MSGKGDEVPVLVPDATAEGETAVTAEEETTGTAEAATETTEAETTTEDAAEHAEELKAGKLSEKQQALVNSLMGRKTAAIREQRERAEKLERELQEAKEAKAEQKPAATEEVLRAAMTAGVLSEHLTAEGAQAIQLASNIEAWRDKLEACGDEETGQGYRGNYGQQSVEWSPAECRRKAREFSRQLDDAKDGAREAKAAAAAEFKKLYALGKAAAKAGWKPGVPAVTTKPAKTGVVVPPVRPAATGAGVTPQATRKAGKPAGWEGIKTTDDFEKVLGAQLGD